MRVARLRGVAAIGTLLLAAGGCAAPASNHVHAALRDDQIRSVLEMVDCGKQYLWTDQAYAFAPMLGATCSLGEGQELRVRVYETGEAAVLGLSDEVAAVRPETAVLAGDTWFVILPDQYLEAFTQALRDLMEVSDSSVAHLRESPPQRDVRDICVIAMASIIDVHSEGDTAEAERIANEFREVYPHAVEAAIIAARGLANDDAMMDVFDHKSNDAYAHDVLLAEIVSPLKRHCD